MPYNENKIMGGRVASVDFDKFTRFPVVIAELDSDPGLANDEAC